MSTIDATAPTVQSAASTRVRPRVSHRHAQTMSGQTR